MVGEKNMCEGGGVEKIQNWGLGFLHYCKYGVSCDGITSGRITKKCVESRSEVTCVDI